MNEGRTTTHNSHSPSELKKRVICITIRPYCNNGEKVKKSKNTEIRKIRKSDKMQKQKNSKSEKVKTQKMIKT